MGNAAYCRLEKMEVIRLKNKAFVYKEHNHVSVYTIGMVLQGKIQLRCNGQYHCYTAGSFFVIPPYQMHALLLPDVYDMLSVCVDKKLLESCKPCDVFAMLSKMLDRLTEGADNDLLAKAIDAMYGCRPVELHNNAIFSSALSLRSNPEKSDGVQVMADGTCYSLYHYIKLFKKHVGMTPHKFQIQNRIRKAQAMIECGKIAADAALELGFYDQSHFIKCFKSIVGLTPSEYSKAVRYL